jgi:molybdopterin biosynthesis enzyme MoaB
MKSTLDPYVLDNSSHRRPCLQRALSSSNVIAKVGNGIRGNTFICNLPGIPKGVREIVPILLPILLHAISDMKQE